jgi:hypothetical protein
MIIISPIARLGAGLTETKAGRVIGSHLRITLALMP